MNNNRVMYKSKLQQLSQQRGWGIPTYEVTKDGQEHNPHFYATVTVDATLFSTPYPSFSTKKAQNDAAKLAYNYFSDHSRASSSSPLNGNWIPFVSLYRFISSLFCTSLCFNCTVSDILKTFLGYCF